MQHQALPAVAGSSGRLMATYAVYMAEQFSHYEHAVPQYCAHTQQTAEVWSTYNTSIAMCSGDYSIKAHL